MKVTIEVTEGSLVAIRDIVADARWIIVAALGFAQLVSPIVTALLP
jgi:hypothetical protein